MSNINQIGVSGLLAFQRALETVSHNISNANTPGYSRQEVDFFTRQPNFLNGRFVGTGVDASAPNRVIDDLKIEQLRQAVSAFQAAQTYAQNAQSIDSILSDESISISQGIQDFFNAMQGLVKDPASLSARQEILESANTLINRFSSLSNQLQQKASGINAQLDTIADSANSLIANIAAVNNEIINSQANNSAPNDLLDKREKLLQDLSELVPIRTVGQDDNAVNVFLESGEVLVLGTTVAQLTTVQSSERADYSVLALTANGVTTPINLSGNSGGRASGLINFREEILASTQDTLDKLAVTFAMSVNSQHSLGMDLDGDLGGDFFADVNTTISRQARAVDGSGNSGNAVIGVTLDDPSLITTDSYELSYDAGTTTYTLTRESDNTVVDTFQPADLPHALATEGFTIALDSGAPADGDTFTIKPIRNDVENLSLSLTNVSDIALASPVRAETPLSNSGEAASVVSGISNRTGNVQGLPITLTYNAGTNSYSISSGGALNYDPATDSGNTYSITVAGFADVDFNISGTPADGDQIILEENTGGFGDNINARALAGLDTQRLLENNQKTFRDVFSSQIASVGSKTRQAHIGEETSQSILTQARDSRDSTSGVNLDEEAAKLIQLQQSYQAAAQVVSASNSIFSVLIQALGR